ncbi:hypothetical protein ACFSL6_24955 [Paenibacillus thailandensis]|uniref:Phage tail tape measure protein n=1 Tax=Paenibacillus thailandensis TaxID=393250 RepID=A0ABW5R404_9BACL
MAKNKQINVILALRDHFSGKVKKTKDEIKKLEREVKRATNSVKSFHSSAISSFDNVIKKTTKTVAGITAIGTTFAATTAAMVAKQGFSEAMDLEGFRLQLETATKSAERAGEIMRWASNFAASTPFETGELVEGASKLEMMGLTAEKYIPLLGDMASSTNKSLDQAIEAMIDANTGELERLIYSLAS